eukprot:3364177-Amphidinium_carterae.1
MELKPTTQNTLLTDYALLPLPNNQHRKGLKTERSPRLPRAKGLELLLLYDLALQLRADFRKNQENTRRSFQNLSEQWQFQGSRSF